MTQIEFVGANWCRAKKKNTIIDVAKADTINVDAGAKDK